MSSTGRALLRGGSFRLVALGTSLLLQMAMLPFVLRHLGDHLYGLWAVIGSATGYYGLLDLGVSSAVALFVSKELGRKDPLAAANYVAAGKKVFLRSALAICVLSVIVAMIGGHFFENPDDRLLFTKTALIVGLGIGFAFPAKLHSGLLVAHLRHDVIAAFSFGSTILRAALIYISLSLGGGILALAIINASISVAVAFATIVVSKRVCATLPIVAKPPAATMQEIARYAGYSLVSQIGNFLRTKIHPITISAFLRLSEVTPYAIQDRLQGIVGDICDACLTMLTPVFSRQDGKGDRDAILRTYLLAYKISCYMGSFLLGMLLIMAPCFLHVWLGRDSAMIVYLLYLRAGGTLAGIIQMPSVNLLIGAKSNRAYAIINSVHAIITLLSTILLIQQWGLPGVVIGVSATTLVMKTVVQASMAGKIVGLGFGDMHFKHTLPNLARTIPFILAAGLLGRAWLQFTWLSLGSFAVCIGAVFAIYIYFVGFNDAERLVIRKSARIWR
jgi:O-antigen/teichoic acid export membrane protein